MAKAAAPKDGRRANRRGAARLAAVQALYQMDLAATPLDDILAEFESHWIGREVEGEQYLPAEAAFFRDVVGGVVAEQRKLDPMIDAALAQGWPLKRIETVLRAILRAGAYELDQQAATCRRAWSCRNMSTSPMPSSIATRPAWSMRCSTSSRGNCAPASSSAATGEAMAQAAQRQHVRRGPPDRALFQAAGAPSRRVRADRRRRGADAAAGPRARAQDRRHRRRRAFFPDDPADAVARKALRVNLSDLAAKGAKPAGFLLSLAIAEERRTTDG